MADKVENRSLSPSGIKYILDSSIRKPTLTHLVLSMLYKNTVDSYMKGIVKVCFKFAAMGDVPQRLILFTALSQLMYKDKVLEKPLPDLKDVGKTNWKTVPKLDEIPSWAVDKHTFRGKFGRASEHIFKKKFKNHPLSEEALREFHGERPKADIKVFFDIGCICNNDILDENPIWEEAKEMYLKQKPSLQKCRKMTAHYYYEMKRDKHIVFTNLGDEETEKETEQDLKRKRKAGKTGETSESVSKRLKKEHSSELTEHIAEGSINDAGESLMMAPKTWPLLQKPTGSGKVYTRLDSQNELVWKGPYQSKHRQNLCLFYHRVMKDIFHDKHTLNIEKRGQYVVFPLIKSETAQTNVIYMPFYDCISKQHISEDEGQFVERSSLGIVQLHKLPIAMIDKLPLSIWAHFAYRFALNIGDTGLYNGIATDDMTFIYGIDMEERRKQVKGYDVLNMLFGKLPRKEIAKHIETMIHRKADSFVEQIAERFDFDAVDTLCKEYWIEDHGQRCKERLQRLQETVLKM